MVTTNNTGDLQQAFGFFTDETFIEEQRPVFGGPTHTITELSPSLTPPPPPAPAADFVPPSYFADLLRYLTPGATRPAIALVGPAGNGKTSAAEAACQARGYDFIVIDATEYLEPADLVGAMTYDPGQGEIWRDGPVTAALRQGQAILINEFDALNPRAALCLQSLAQDAGPTGAARYLTTPGAVEQDRVYPAGDCPLIVTMNTFGTGATREYVGRNALDAATADRFTIMATGYENEAAILIQRGCDTTTAERLAAWAREMRVRIERDALRIILSLRTLLRMMQAITVYGQSFDTAIEKEFLNRLNPEDRALLEA